MPRAKRLRNRKKAETNRMCEYRRYVGRMTDLQAASSTLLRQEVLAVTRSRLPHVADKRPRKAVINRTVKAFRICRANEGTNVFQAFKSERKSPEGFGSFRRSIREPIGTAPCAFCKRHSSLGGHPPAKAAVAEARPTWAVLAQRATYLSPTTLPPILSQKFKSTAVCTSRLR